MYFEKEYTDGFFNVSGSHGFLPIKEPLAKLPSQYDTLQHVINCLHVKQNDGILGIPNEIVKAVASITNYLSAVEQENDVFILQALYRAYTFITSGFTLELSYQEFVKSGNYGVARQLLPANIAEPLVCVSNKLKAYPWLDYHYAYSLGNYVKQDINKGLHWDNLDMACKFVGSSDEIGFIMVHVYINEESPELVDSVIRYGKVNSDSTYKGNIMCNELLSRAGITMQEINKRRREMWTASKHENYNDFRVFIMGIKGNDKIFPNGLIYENCFNGEPQYYRGQTGAQDNIIPMMDIFTGIVDYYPDNQLTQYLLDLRSYRPVCIQEFFNDLREYYKNNSIFEKFKKDLNFTGLIYLLCIVNEVYLFRNGHWQFVQKYIMSNTKYAFATGGTPITTWLINQIEAVLEFEKDIIEFLKSNNFEIPWSIIENKYPEHEFYSLAAGLIEGLPRKQKLLLDQVNELKNANYDINLIYMKNQEMKLEDASL
jgi:indoleamine 2,3-dioxygenase